MIKLKNIALPALAALAASAIAVGAAGLYEGFPVTGGNSYCASYTTGVTGQVCASTVPAGPSGLSGNEVIAADNYFAGGASPQTTIIPSSMLGSLNTKVNKLIGGDFSTGQNLWQRSTTPLTGASPTVATMTADRWWAISASNVVTVSKQTPAASAANYFGNFGFYSSMRVARPSGTPSGVTCTGQTLDQQIATELIGNNAIFSFYGYAPTTFSAANYNVTVTIAYFTATDAAATQAAIADAGGNSSTFALSASGQAGGITGYQAAVGGVSPGTVGTVASGVATIPLSVTPTRYAVWAPIPRTNAAGTAVTSVGVALCFTPTLTTTVATDYFDIAGTQLQAMPSVATPTLPNGVIAPTGFERRQESVEQANQLYYSYVIQESATALNIRALCADSTANTAFNCPIAFPVPMRLAPNAKYVTGFEVCTTVACVAANTTTPCTLTTSASVTGLAITNKMAPVLCSVASGSTAAIGLTSLLFDGGTNAPSPIGQMSFSAEP